MLCLIQNMDNLLYKQENSRAIEFLSWKHYKKLFAFRSWNENTGKNIEMFV